MSDCHSVRNQLGEFLVGALEGEVSSLVERHLEECHACSRELVELQRLEGALWSVERAPARSGTARWLLAAAAAALLVLAPSLWLLSPRAGTLRSGRVSVGERVLAARGALPAQRRLAVLEPAEIELAGSELVQAREGTRLELLGEGGIRLSSGEAFFQVQGGRGRFAVETPLGTATVPGTSFLVQVKDEPVKEELPMSAGAVVKGSAVTVVMVAVVTGTVLWYQKDGSPPQRIEAGKQGIARAGSFTLGEFGPEKVQELSRENEELRREKVALDKDRVELREKVSSLQAELASAGEKAAASRPLVEGFPVSFGKWNELPELKGTNWKEAGEAAAAMSGPLKEFLEKGEEGELSPEVRLRLARENMKLSQLALKVNGKLPTHASGNGEYTHPFVNWNVLAAELEVAGLPLSEDQLAGLGRLGEEYEKQWERLQRSYSPQSLALEKVLDEVELKKTFNDRMEALLSREQREAVVDPETHDVNHIDIHSPLLALSVMGRPLYLESKDQAREKAVQAWSQAWEVDPAQLEAIGPALDGWLGELDPRLVPVQAKQAPFYDLRDAMAAGRAQVKVMKYLLASTALEEKVRKKVLGQSVFLVPRLVQKGK